MKICFVSTFFETLNHKSWKISTIKTKAMFVTTAVTTEKRNTFALKFFQFR